ncbi:hypothetical protein [Aquimarina longa]|uniref:hypothetical protein n=1 Tax=Aquimarina longa TaxID=1080221 RepID=UPI000785E117|nr:hypothetical protein [Aquimarina longa]
MKRINQIIVALCCSITLISCAQDHKKNNMKRPIEQLYSNVDSLDYETMPQYYIEGYQSGCFYEIYINGILRFKHYENVGLMNHSTPINDLILQSGTQKVTVKLFPLGKIGDQEFTTIDADAKFRLKIFKRDKKQPYEALGYDVVKEYFAPTVSGERGDAFLNAGVPYYEETFTFEAEVPYELKGWSESQVLTKLDQKELEEEILDFYNEYDDIIQKQDEEKWVGMVKKRELEYLKSVHYNDSKNHKIRRRVDHSINIFDTELVHNIPLDEYEIIFGGDGKVVTLKSVERLGMSAYSFAQNKNRNGKRAKARTSYYLFLHKPKGSNKLEIIR